MRWAAGPGISSCCSERARPRSPAPDRSAPHSHAPDGVAVPHVIRLGPAHRRPRSAGLLAPLALRGALRARAAACAAACGRAGHRRRAPSRRYRYRGLYSFQPGHLAPQLLDRPLLPGDLLALLGDHRARTAHEPHLGTDDGRPVTSNHDKSRPAVIEETRRAGCMEIATDPSGHALSPKADQVCQGNACQQDSGLISHWPVTDAPAGRYPGRQARGIVFGKNRRKGDLLAPLV
jgi:hypothetical protein